MLTASLLDLFGDDIAAHIDKRVHSDTPLTVAELVGIDSGVAHIDERHAAKHPDWTYDAFDSGKSPAERLGEHRSEQALDE